MRFNIVLVAQWSIFDHNINLLFLVFCTLPSSFSVPNFILFMYINKIYSNINKGWKSNIILVLINYKLMSSSKYTK